MRARAQLIVFAAAVALVAPQVIAPREAEAGEPVAVVYGGFGTTEGAFVSGRALQNAMGQSERQGNRAPTKFGKSLLMFGARPASGAIVDIVVGLQSYSIKADKHGYFELELGAAQLGKLKSASYPVNARVRGSAERVPNSTGQLRLFAKDATVVVSDLDDTILHSQVEKKAKLIKDVAFNAPADMVPVEGAAKLYKKLADQGMPLIVLTSTPYQMFGRIKEFLSLNGFPAATMMMKKLGAGDSINEHGGYKLRQLERVQKYLPRNKFVLVGDSGQQDAATYAEFRSRVGAERVRAIAIRQMEPAHDTSGLKKALSFASFKSLGIELMSRKVMKARTFLQKNTDARARIAPHRTSGRSIEARKRQSLKRTRKVRARR